MGEVPPVSKTGDFFKRREEEVQELPKPPQHWLDAKIQKIVLAQIKSSQTSPLASALLPCSAGFSPAIALAPSTVYGALSELMPVEEVGPRAPDDPRSSKREPAPARRILCRKPSREKKRVSRDLYSTCRKRQIPIGLSRCEAWAPLNALMQWIVFIPGFREAFLFAPQSASSIADFIEQYMADQEQKEPLCKADSSRLIQLLFHRLPSYFFNKSAEFDVAGFLFDFVQAIVGKRSGESIAFHPEWHVQWNPAIAFVRAMDLLARPPELLVSMQHSESSVVAMPRQFFLQSVKTGAVDAYCYDLDAFIERQEGGWAAYVKTADGIWYRCIDSTVIAMRSTHLKTPLSQSVLSHYTRIWP